MEVFVLFPSEDDQLQKEGKRIYLNEPGWCEKIGDSDIVHIFSNDRLEKALLEDGILKSNIRIMKRPRENLLFDLFNSTVEDFVSSLPETKKIELLKACVSIDYDELIDYIIAKAFREESLGIIKYVVQNFPPSIYKVSEKLSYLVKDMPDRLTFGKEKGKSTLVVQRIDKRPLQSVISSFKEMELNRGIKFVLDQAILSKDVRMLGVLTHISPIRVKLSFPEESYPEEFLTALLRIVPYNSSYIKVLSKYPKYHDYIKKDPVFLQSFEFYHEKLSSEIVEKIKNDILLYDIVHLFKYLPLDKWGSIPKEAKKIREYIRLKSL